MASEETKLANVEVSHVVKDNEIAKDGVKENGVAKDGCNEDWFATENATETAGGVVTEGVNRVRDDTEDNGKSSSLSVTGNEDSIEGDEEIGGSVSGCNEHEKAALAELRSKLEEAILTNNLFKNHRKIKADGRNRKSDEQEPKRSVEEEEKKTQDMQIGADVKIWGVPLLPSKRDERTNVILLKFLKARDFKPHDSLEMLRNTMTWRKDNRIDSILDEDFGSEYDSVVYMNGMDCEGHPVCYNVYGVFANNEIYNKTFGTEESRDRFLRWRLQMMEKEIRNLDFKPGGVSSLLQINDLKDTPGPARKDLRIAMKQAVALLQDNYPEFVARNIFINVPFWYYAFNALLSPFLTQRTKSKFVFTRPARVTETLIKHIDAEEIPVHYGGLKRQNDPDFSTKDVVCEIFVKAGSTETIEIPAPESGSTLMWELTVQGWEVNYKEEFIPRDEGSYTILVNKGRRIGCQLESLRNSFTNNEAGKIVLTLENGSFKKKRVLYRFKTNNKNGATSSS